MINIREKYVRQLNKIKFIGIPIDNMGTGLATFLTFNQDITYNQIKELYYSYKKFPDYEIKKTGKSNIMFLISNSYGDRKDHTKWFKRNALNADNRIEVFPGKNCIKSKNLYFYLLLWFFQMRKIDMPFWVKIGCCLTLKSGLNNFYILKKIIDENKTNIKLAVVLCDIHMIDNILVQYCKSLNLKTATMQHGNYYKAWLYRYSYSDYFLTYGEYTKNVAEYFGLESNKLILAGPPMISDIEKVEKIVINNNKIFIIILEGDCNEINGAKERNKNLILLSNEFSKKYNYKYIIRTHPSDAHGNYSNVIDKDVFIKFIKGNLNRKEIIDSVDFALLNRTTMFTEFIYGLLPSFLYVEDFNMYRGINWCKFSDLQEFSNLYDKFFNNIDLLESKMLETRDYICGKGNIDLNYRKFYEEFM